MAHKGCAGIWRTCGKTRSNHYVIPAKAGIQARLTKKWMPDQVRHYGVISFRQTQITVIPAKAGIQVYFWKMDSRFRGNDVGVDSAFTKADRVFLFSLWREPTFGFRAAPG